MKIAALSDLHLGARLPGRTEGGRSIREMDVERAWKTAVQRCMQQNVELVLIAGDVFDTVTPPTHAKAAFIEGVRDLSDSGAWVVVIGGNHETPKTAGVLSPNMLVAGMRRVAVVEEPGPVRLRLSGPHALMQSVCIWCAPYQALAGERVIVPTPDPAADVNILLIHAAVRSSARPGTLPAMYGGPTSYDVARAEGFDVVACGDFHERRVLAPDFLTPLDDRRSPPVPSDLPYRWDDKAGPLAFYPGALERVTSNVWDETAPKSFCIVDTDERTLVFHEVPTRPMFSYSLDEWTMGGPGDVSTLDAALLELGNVDHTADALVRLVVEDFPRSERDGIDWRLANQLKQRCVHFHLDVRYAATEAADLGDRRGRQGRTLEQEATDFFAGDEPAVRDLALGFLGFAPQMQEVALATA